jgi:hypothetical protein
MIFVLSFMEIHPLVGKLVKGDRHADGHVDVRIP